jgi:hypothetical protein
MKLKLQRRFSGEDYTIGSLYVDGGGLTETVIVTQAAETSAASLFVSPPTATVDAFGDSVDVAIISNVSWTVSSSESWATFSPSSGTDNGTVSITAATNTGTERTATITISGGGITRTVGVAQASAEAPSTSLTVSPATLSIAATGGSGNIAVSSNVRWTASSSASWATLSRSSGSNNGTVTVTATANAGTERTATITISGSGITRTVSVTQAAAEVQDVVVDSVPPANGEPGHLIIRFGIPTDNMFSSKFFVLMPVGVTIDMENTALIGFPAELHELSIVLSDNIWSFEIKPKTSLRSASTEVSQDILQIAWTVDESVVSGTYEIRISDLEITLDDGSVIKKDEIKVPVTISNPAGLTPVESLTVWYGSGILTINTPQAERIEVYSVAGQLLYVAQKDAGKATFDLNGLSRGVLIVRGGSGWVRKIVR